MGDSGCTVPWTVDMKLGDGYDMDEFRIVASALSDVETKPDHMSEIDGKKRGDDFDYQFQVVGDETEFKQAMDASLEGAGSVPFVFSSALSTKLLRGVQCSETSMTTIIRCIFTTRATEVVDSPKLNSKAARLLQRRLLAFPPFRKDPQKMQENYGQYYVYSYISKSSITIVSTHSASTRKELQDFKASSTGGYTGPTLEISAKGVYNFLKNVSKSRVKTTMKVACEGYNRDGVADSEGLSANEASKIFKNFLENLRPERCIAVLRPLSSIDSRIPRPTESKVTSTLKAEWKECLYLANRAQSSPMVGARSLAMALLGLAEQMRQSIRIKELDDSGFKKLVANRQDFQSQITDFDRRHLLLETSNARPRILKTEEWTKAVEKEVKYHSVSAQKAASEDVIGNRQRGTANLDCGDRLIIGFRVKSVRETPDNGWWRLMNGGVQDGRVEIAFKTRRYEPGHWTLECWSVDRSLYNRKG
ncbi:hypothetical protein V8E54_004428 [Elaphomyces granulatus]